MDTLNSVAAKKIYVVIRDTATAPGPGRPAQSAADGQPHRSVAAFIGEDRPRCIGSLLIDFHPTGLNEKDILPQTFEFQSQCHTDWTRANHADIPV